MEKKKYYTAGKFARKAGITLRALRYYDEVGLLKPSARAENGYRLYCEEDMVRLHIGFGHMKELFDLVKDFEPRVHFYNMDSVYYFGKERGREFLKPYFEQIEWYSYENEIMVNDVESITEYVWNTYSNVQQVLEKRREELKRYIAKVIAKQGCLRFKMEAGLFAAKKTMQEEKEKDDYQA